MLSECNHLSSEGNSGSVVLELLSQPHDLLVITTADQACSDWYRPSLAEPKKQ